MLVINAEFIPMEEMPVVDLLDAVGVYVLWTPAAEAKPSYIGEGMILKRLASHIDNFGRGLNGCVAVLPDGNMNKRKTDAEILERTLLEAADRLNVFPQYNKILGRYSTIWRKGSYGHNVIRVNVQGFHPLKWGTKLRGTSALTWRFGDGNEQWNLEVPWRRS